VSMISPYSIAMQFEPSVVLPHSSECEWKRPNPCPNSWDTTFSSKFPLIQASEGLPPSVDTPQKGQASF
jgi:hypothetical protein